MGGDHVEHALSYFVMWQLFHSPLLAGFAVISHWLPHLLFGVISGGLADRYDCRKVVQFAQGLFILASLGWGIFIALGALQPWICVLLLLIHGFASAIWAPAEQMMIYDIVGGDDLPSGVRLHSTGMNLGTLVGPVVGAALLFTIGPAIGMFVNIAIYLPFVIFLLLVPYTGHSRSGAAAGPRLTLGQMFGVIREVPRYPAILMMLILQGAVGLLIGTTLLPLLPEFADLLGQDDSGLGYGALLAAMSLGAVVAGIGIEALGRVRATTRLAVVSTIAFAASLLVFAYSRDFALSVAMLVIAGMGSLISTSTSMTVVQLTAPVDRRGRFIGAYTMASMGLRVGSGVIIGVIGSLVGATTAFGVDAAILLGVTIVLLVIVLVWRARRPVEPVDVVEVTAQEG
jgi:MFS family permease